MLDIGYAPRVASAPLESNRNAIEGKIKWLDRIMVPHFGVSVVEDAIIDKNKWKYSALAIIDDNTVIRKGIGDVDSAEWEHVLFWLVASCKCSDGDGRFSIARLARYG